MVQVGGGGRIDLPLSPRGTSGHEGSSMKGASAGRRGKEGGADGEAATLRPRRHRARLERSPSSTTFSITVIEEKVCLRSPPHPDPQPLSLLLLL